MRQHASVLIEVDEEKTITFEQGLIGFSELTRFIVLDHAPGSKFHWLQSVEKGEIAFPIVDPDHFVDGYVVKPPNALAELIGEFRPDDLFLAVIVTFPQGGGPVTLNLKAPVILNTQKRRGVQLVLEDPNAPVRFPLGGN